MTFNHEPLNQKSPKDGPIERCFLRVKNENRIALMPFLMAGDPDLKTSSEIILRLQDEGADLLEIGIPYSDPLADGPVIQASAERALRSGTTPSAVFEMLNNLRGKLSIPFVLFTYSNPLLSRGFESFCTKAADIGAAGLVVPDLPLEEAERLSPVASSNGLDLVLLVAPTTPQERMIKIASVSRGFTYLVSVTGVTGERSVLDERVQSLVKELHNVSDLPVAVGFGISGAQQISQVRSWGAEGAIVGSALIKRISESPSGSESDVAGKFCKELHLATV